MADYTEIINLEDHKRGDKWYGVPKIGPILINKEQPSLPLSRIRMGFQSTMGETYIIDTETGVSANATGLIENSITWQGSIPEVDNFLPSDGDWQWDMEFYESGKSSPLTFYKGVISVNDDITK